MAQVFRRIPLDSTALLSQLIQDFRRNPVKDRLRIPVFSLEFCLFQLFMNAATLGCIQLPGQLLVLSLKVFKFLKSNAILLQLGRQSKSPSARQTAATGITVPLRVVSSRERKMLITP